MGRARFELVVPSTVTGLYIGVKDWSSTKTSYVRVDNLFGADMIWSISLGGSAPVPHQLSNPRVLLAEQPNRVLLSWQQDRFELVMNGHRLTARSSGPGPAAAPPLSRLFIWSFTRGRQAGEMQQELMSITPQPSPVMLNAQIRCAVCHGEKSLLFPQWCICPRCFHMVMRSSCRRDAMEAVSSMSSAACRLCRRLCEGRAEDVRRHVPAVLPDVP